MSDGGGESGREKEEGGKKKSGGDDYGRAVAKIAVAQTCENVGFQGFQQSALETLSVIAVRYLRDLGKSAHLYANSAGRTECNVFDIIHGMEDMGLAQGFIGASDVNRLIASSGTVREIMQYVNMEEEIPFAQPVPQFPVIRSRKATPSFLQTGENPSEEHIPAWLPRFPDPNTYVQTPIGNESTMDSHGDNAELARQQEQVRQKEKEQVRQQRKAERRLFSLQQQMGSNGSVVTTTADLGDNGKAKQIAQSNPFLAPPLPFGEKGVSPIVVPARLSSGQAIKKQGSVLESLTPASTVAKNGFCDSKESDKKVLPTKRAAVHLKFGSRKKSCVAPVDLTFQNDAEPTDPCFGMDDDKDEKEKEAEQIVKDSVENPDELAHL